MYRWAEYFLKEWKADYTHVLALISMNGVTKEIPLIHLIQDHIKMLCRGHSMGHWEN